MPQKTKNALAHFNLGFDALCPLAEQAAQKIKKPWNAPLAAILQAITTNPDLSPELEPNQVGPWLESWIGKYYTGFEQRPSQRSGCALSTKADPIIGEIIQVKLPELDEPRIRQIIDDHRLAMSAENILGHILEEYIADQLAPYGWHACWGYSIKKVDFVYSSGLLLQVKNRSNSENSSSGSVREGTKVLKWHRIAAQSGETRWDKFPELPQKPPAFSEEGFQTYVKALLTQNPGALVLEHAVSKFEPLPQGQNTWPTT